MPAAVKKPAATASTPATPAATNGEAKGKRGFRRLPEGFGRYNGQLSFAEAPPANARSRGKRGAWDEVLAQLMANPGLWAPLGVWTTANNRPTKLKEAGCLFRTAQRVDGNGDEDRGPNGEAKIELWASYPADDED